MLPTEDLLQSYRHTHTLYIRGWKNIFLQMEVTRKQREQYSYQTKQTLKQQLQQKTNTALLINSTPIEINLKKLSYESGITI